MSTISTEILCPICHEEITTEFNRSHTECGHIFHSGCIDNWLKRTLECPMCRNIIT